MTEQTPELSAFTQQMMAIASCVGITIGVLRAKGLLENAEADAIFDMADQILPDNCSHAAAQALTTIRTASRAVKNDG